ncbi:MAG: oligosaccharide flippase family protein [Anaerolineae bacterium]|nr:oligosaccharide flippase family protein [Anaerolineae bacterium]
MIRRVQDFFQRKFVRDTLALQIGKIGTTGMTVLSSVLVFRLLSPEAYGAWALTFSFFTIWQTLNLTGVNVSTSTRLGMAVGAQDEPEILNLTAFYVQMSSGWAALSLALFAIIGPILSGLAYNGDTHIGILSAWLSLTILPDALYSLVMIAFQSQRAMRTLAVLQNINQFALLLCTGMVLLISPTPEGMVASRLIYSVSTLLVALVFYSRMRQNFAVHFPAFGTILRRAFTVSPRLYWRFGVLNALDKNVANLYTEIPLQIVGIYVGKAAAGHLEFAFKAMTLTSILTSAVFDNLQAVVPQAVGRGDFARLQKNFIRVMLTLALTAAGFYTAFVLLVPLFVPLVYGDKSIPAVPVIQALSVYGMVTMIGGIFGPLYRALNLMLSALLIKILALMIILVPSLLWFQQDYGSALGGAWMINGLFTVSIVLTAAVTLPALKRKATDSEIKT